MISRAAAVGWAVLLFSAGSVHLGYPNSGGTAEILGVEVAFGPLAPGSAAGAVFANATVLLPRTLTPTTTYVLWLNNTNATGVWHARIVSEATTGLATISALTIGIDNGTAPTPQVVAALGALTQTTGPFVRLGPGSSNRIYVTHAESLLAGSSALTLRIEATEAPGAGPTVHTPARLELG